MKKYLFYLLVALTLIITLKAALGLKYVSLEEGSTYFSNIKIDTIYLFNLDTLEGSVDVQNMSSKDVFIVLNPGKIPVTLTKGQEVGYDLNNDSILDLTIHVTDIKNGSVALGFTINPLTENPLDIKLVAVIAAIVIFVYIYLFKDKGIKRGRMYDV
jgi:hypothetical protein